MRNFFTFEGSLARLDYFIKLVVLFISTFVITLVLGFFFGFITSLGINIPVIQQYVPIIGAIAIMIAYVTSYLSITARRLHDLGFSGWWQAIPILLPFVVFIYVWLNLHPMLGELGINITNPATYQNFSFSNVTSEQQQTAISTFEKASVMNTISGIISLIFYLCLLFWPPRRINNKYAFDDAGAFHHDPRKTNYGKDIEYFVRLKEPIHEDSVYVIGHIKTELPGVKKINMPNDRSNMTFIVSNPNIKPKDIKKLLHKNGFFTTSIKQIVS